MENITPLRTRSIISLDRAGPYPFTNHEVKRTVFPYASLLCVHEGQDLFMNKEEINPNNSAIIIIPSRIEKEWE